MAAVATTAAGLPSCAEMPRHSAATASPRLAHPRARLYESVRTAHLERALQLEPASILYRVERYDFQEDLARGLDVHRLSPVRAALLLRRSPLDALEVNEPLMLSGLPGAALAVFAVRAFRRRRSRPRIVTYAIGNVDPFAGPARSWKNRIRRRIERMLSRYVWRRIDRVAFGTSAARDVYHQVLPRAAAAERVIPALPAARQVREGVKIPGTVVFLGDFSPRKGFPLLLEAWPLVRAQRPEARLTLIGKGRLLAEAEAFAETHPDVSLVVDPPREQIRALLAESSVLTLPSQPTPTWREQVGLPIVEALEAGCSVVTTTETGLADWLREHDHGVVAGTAGAQELAAAIIGQIDAGDRSAAVSASLPPRDGRLAADAWMFGAGSPAEGTAND